MKYLGSTDIGQDLAIKNYIDEGDLVNHPDSVLSTESMKPLENRIISRYLQNVAVNFRYNKETGRFVLLNAFGDEIGNVRFIGKAAVYTPTLLNMSESDNFTMADGTNVLLAFNYSSVDTNSADDGPGTAVVTVNGTSTDPFSVIQGSNTFDVTDLLSDGENIISIRAENSEHLVASLFYKVNVLSVKISANLCAQNAYFGDTAIEYVVRGSGSKVVHFEMDGIDIGTATVTTSGKPSIFNIPAQNPGVHQLRVYAVCNQNGQAITSNVLSYGMIWADEALPEIQLAANQHAVRFFDIDGTYLYGYAANDGDAIVDPVTENLISAPTLEGTTDTQYAYSGWGTVPATITEDYAAVASYTTSYLVTFMNLATQFATQWVPSGSTATSPATDPTREGTDSYGYRFDGWTTDPDGTAVQDDSLTNVIAPRTVYAVFTQLQKYTVQFVNGTSVIQTLAVLSGETPIYTGETPVSSEDQELQFNGWEPAIGPVTANITYTAVFVDTRPLMVQYLASSLSKYISAPEDVLMQEFPGTWQDLVNSIDDGTYRTKYKVGQYKNVDFGTEGIIKMQIIGINKDVDENGDFIPITLLSKKQLSGGGVAFGTRNGVPVMWKDSNVRNNLYTRILSNIPEPLKSRLWACLKYTCDYGGQNTESIEQLFVPSRYELHQTVPQTSSFWMETKGPVYNSALIPKNGWYWTRSKTTPSAETIQYNQAGGKIDAGYNTYQYDIYFGFCIGRAHE